MRVSRAAEPTRRQQARALISRHGWRTSESSPQASAEESASTWVRTKAAARAPGSERSSASTSGPARNRTVIIGVRCAYAVRRPSTRRRSPMTQAMYRSWFLHRDTHTTAEGSGPGTARSWACSSGCTTCADDKVAKRPHATRRLADSQVQVYFWTREKNGCGDGGKTGDAVGRDVGMYVGTLLVGTLVGV